MDIDTFAAEVRKRRLSRGWSVEEAARRAGINRVTYRRMEDGLPVQDVKRRVVEELFDLADRGDSLSAGAVAGVEGIVGSDLNPELADFTDQELLDEIGGRMLLVAGRLSKATGAELLSVVVDQDGERRIVSHSTKRS